MSTAAWVLACAFSSHGGDFESCSSLKPADKEYFALMQVGRSARLDVHDDGDYEGDESSLVQQSDLDVRDNSGHRQSELAVLDSSGQLQEMDAPPFLSPDSTVSAQGDYFEDPIIDLVPVQPAPEVEVQQQQQQQQQQRTPSAARRKVSTLATRSDLSTSSHSRVAAAGAEMAESPAFWAMLLVALPVVLVIGVLWAIAGLHNESTGAPVHASTRHKAVLQPQRNFNTNPETWKKSPPPPSNISDVGVPMTFNDAASEATSYSNFSLSRTMDGSSMYSGPLCAAMLVPPPNMLASQALGLEQNGTSSTILVLKGATPMTFEPQCSTYDCALLKGTGREAMIGRLLFAENPQRKDSGVLLEHGSFPIAVVDTSTVLGPNGLGNSVRIMRADGSRMEPFAVVKRGHGPGEFQVVSEIGSRMGMPLLHVHVPAVVRHKCELLAANFTDHQGRLVASVERSNDPDGTCKYSILFGGAPTDGALVILCLVAAVKLSVK